MILFDGVNGTRKFIWVALAYENCLEYGARKRRDDKGTMLESGDGFHESDVERFTRLDNVG
jgi:hypothetical protein